MPFETGYNGVIASLGNYKGRAYRGRECVTTQFAVTTTAVAIAGSNNQRISILVQNEIASADSIYLCLGQTPSATRGIRIYQGGSYQIDPLMPWTGDIWIVCPTSTATVNVQEMSVS